MADEFQSGVCGGNWWNPSRNYGNATSPCTTALNDMGSFGWPTERSPDESAASVSADSSIVFQDAHKPQPPDSDGGGGSALIDSTLQMMGFGLSSTTTSDWNQALLRGSGRAESNYNSMLNYQREIDSPQIQKDWSPKNFLGSSGEDSTINPFKPINQTLSLEQQRLSSVTSTGTDCTATCQALSAGFPMGSASYGYPSTLIQSLFEPDPQPQQSVMNYPSTANYRTNVHELPASTWTKFTPLLKPPLPKMQPTSHLHFSNNTTFWNASAAALTDIRANFSPLQQQQPQFLTQTFEEKPHLPNLHTKGSTQEVQDSGPMVKKSSCSEPAFKRPRIETPSPLPTFKVRKEKLGDRITALQQLVSPFGKTDTASVLHEAIEYIKFLHDQVSALSTPYMKNGAPIQHQQTSDHKLKEAEGPKQDLRSRGLCLVPISSTFPVANEPASDFWTPTFGGTFR